MLKTETSWETYEFLDPKISNIENPTILAFSCYFHDSSTCIIKNGKLIAAVDEERFTRKKHDANFPINSIKYCVDQAGVEAVDFVVFYENPDLKWKRIEEALNKHTPPEEIYKYITDTWTNLKSKRKIQEVFSTKIGLENEIIFLDHHMSHAASSYFMSPFDESAVVTIDGVGEKATTSFGYGKENSLKLYKCINFPHSIGLLYTAITVYLGFKANDHEYKVMGLAPYGESNKKKNPYYEKLKKTIILNDDGSFYLDMKYFSHDKFEKKPFTSELIDLLEIEPNGREAPINQSHKNLACALQMITEDTVLHLLNHVYEETKSQNLCLAGGVALNSVLNGKIISHTPFKYLFIQPSAGDSGTVIGAAKYIQHLTDKKTKREHMIQSSYGPAYSNEEIEDYLIEDNIVYKKLGFDQLIKLVARLLKDKKVIGWFQGNMEWGPRALGNRSILASPLDSDMRDILNSKVKHRELFRPFAPVVCIDDAKEYFVCDDPIPEPTDFMLMVYPVQKDKQSLIPAVTHVDGSGRLQTIRKSQNPLYYDLIKCFGELTGVPILVNTSFNIRGEPIVCSPMEAYKCMMGTGIDYLVMDRFLISRADNLKDAWEPAIID